MVDEVGPLFFYACIICHLDIEVGQQAVLFDKSPATSVVLAAHGHCISKLSRYVITDADRAREFSAYRHELQQRFGMAE